MRLTLLPTNPGLCTASALRLCCERLRPRLFFILLVVTVVFSGLPISASGSSPDETNSLVSEATGADHDANRVDESTLPTSTDAGLGKAPGIPRSLEQSVYHCESGATLIAAYEAEADVMWVRYQDEVQSLAPVIAASGAKFGGDEVPWGFWSKGDEGFVFAYEADGSEGDFVDTCWVRQPTVENAAESDDGRRWSLELHSDYIVLLDCVDCGDDIGAVLECRERGEPARLSIFWAAVDSEEPLSESLTLEVAGEVFERPAETSYAGQIGRFPQIGIGPDDPVLGALKANREMKVKFAGVETRIGLSGFAAAFQEFDDACPWRPDDTTHAHTVGGGEVASAQNDPASRQPRWMLSGTDDEDGDIRAPSLSFGIPETDAVAFTASCAGLNQSGLVDLVAVVEVGDRSEDEAVDLVVTTNAMSLQLRGEVSTGQTAYPGVRARIGHRHPLWAVLQLDEQVSLRADNGPAVTLPSSDTSGRIEEFLGICSE